ncbi:MAG: MFS transporter [Dissulfurimicrobium sp.]|uniref:MFS transporter n=1 Tax=Dissulfurimicrobium TaxID=1769732 RepID=UPI001EDBCC8F|nr:MFS transporter [Dissulfurimicrobium hydrothermale]UKL14610.1 MFS transporter [Dissulfurimicrobium hydrothermale]
MLPQFTQDLLEYPAFQAGLVIAPRAFMLLLFMPIVGRLYNHIDARVLVIFGVGITFWSYYDLAGLSLAAGFWNLVPTLLIMGIGMPFVFVPLSTLSLSTVPSPDMTDATGLYTLARRVGGNIGYALAATMVDRGQQIHRSYLVDHVNPFNMPYAEYNRIAGTALRHAGLNTQGVQHTIYALTNRIVDMQSTMLTYNDISWVFGLLFLSIIPLVLLLARAYRPGQQIRQGIRKLTGSTITKRILFH